MNTLVKLLIILVMSHNVAKAQEQKGQDITVYIENLNSDNGNVFISLYNTKASFLGQGYKSTISSIKNKSCKVTFENVPNGVYAISFFHDENDNKKMDANFLGIPKEDYGCSNNARGFMGPPKWEDAKFQVNNKSITQTITL